MNLINFSILEYCDNKTLQKYSCLSEKIKELYNQRIEKGDFNEDIDLINQIDLIFNEDYSFYSFNKNYFECFNSIFNECVLILFNKKKYTFDLFDLNSNNDISVNQIESNLNQNDSFIMMKYHYSDFLKKEYIIISSLKYNISIYEYKNFNLLLLNNLSYSYKLSFSNLRNVTSFEYNNVNFFSRFNYYSNKLEFFDFNLEKKFECSINNKMEHIEVIKSNNTNEIYFVSWFYNGISSYKITNNKIKSLKSFSSYNKLTLYIIFMNFEKIIECNCENLIIWNIITGKIINKILLCPNIEKITQLIKWNEEIYYAITDLSYLYKINIKNNNSKKYNIKLNDLCICKKLIIKYPSLIFLNNLGKIMYLTKIKNNK